MKKVLLLILLFFLSCDNGGGGGGGPVENPELTIRVSNDCNGITECVEVSIDGNKVAEDLKAGEEVIKKVEIGNHTIYAKGSCSVFNEWGPYVVYVPAEGKTEVLSCSTPGKGILTVRCMENCIDIIKRVDLYVDDLLRATLKPEEIWKGSLVVGKHKIYGISERGDVWGPKEIVLTSEGYTEELNCNDKREGLFIINVTQNCPCNFIYGINIYYTEPSSSEPILAGNINPGNQISFKATVGYHRISAVANCFQDNKEYRYGPVEVYLPEDGLNYTIYCNEFKP